jgi:hypothetical protein
MRGGEHTAAKSKEGLIALYTFDIHPRSSARITHNFRCCNGTGEG